MKHNLLATAVKLALTGALAGSLAACGGSSGGSDSAGVSSGTSVGPVSGFGSVFVNGTKFSTDGTVKSNDGIEREDQLEKGMILKVRGDWSGHGEGKARTVSYDDTLRGPVTSMTWDAASRTGKIVMLGQTVVVDGRTVFRGATPGFLESNATGYRVRISGWRTAEGEFRASFVGARADGVEFDGANDVEIEGVVKDLDTSAQTFTINGFLIDYERAKPEDGFALEDLANGMVVEVEGALSADNKTLLATEISDESDWLGGEDDDVEISGELYDYDEAGQLFYINGVLVQITTNTEFDDIRKSDLKNGVHVEVEGEYRDGVLYAEEIEGQEADVELEGVVESIDLENETLMVSGVKVQLTTSTLIDEGDDNERRSRVRDIQSFKAGDFLEVEGYQRSDDGGYLEAVSVKYESGDPSGCAELEARVFVTDLGSIRVMNLEILPGAYSLAGLDLDEEVELEYCPTGAGEYDLSGSPEQ
ncbi:DUF5666 domain-containing protein [Marinobacter xiaoshiensis]|uniref:DUF5666 domain-containing protein n=1 Tax=Marinobacter xiaoshiensis TaxID=3073652 RepID=A0ABU2HDP6_9GAMM|nr:DUF5666 domain-containing protein [Marinobacter sp. F60267]MDS1309189.1 DUF5666 domain-containing protein [Marinobacter sp. F60267]